MTEPNKRDEWDRHNRDEAQARAAQQVSAGPTHRPVVPELYARVGAPSQGERAERSLAALVDEYERATTGERLAWLALRACIESQGADAGEWDEWRDALERTQSAARALIESGR